MRSSHVGTSEVGRQSPGRTPADDQAAWRIFQTTWGWTGIVTSELGVARLILPKKDKDAATDELEDPGGVPQRGGQVPRPELAMIEKTVDLVRKYFSGQLVLFDLPLDLRYYTFFQQRVWRAVQGIPYGETRSYGWIARRIGRPKSARAVGQAVGANPVPLFVP